MLYQILSLLLDVAAGLLGGACLLRLYMQYQKRKGLQGQGGCHGE